MSAEEGRVGPVNVGLDIGATKTLGVVIGDAGGILAAVREATEPGTDGVVRTAARVVEALRAATGAPLTGAVGVGIPGLVDTLFRKREAESKKAAPPVTPAATLPLGTDPIR